MCLFTNDKKPKTAGLPGVRCLKIVRKTVHPDGTVAYRSPFALEHPVSYRIGQVAEMRGDIIEDLKLCNFKVDCTWLSDLHKKYSHICNHGLHTFHPESDWRKVYDRLLEILDYPEDSRESLAVLECRIPHGTNYYEGMSNCMTEECDERGYASERLKVEREIDINRYKR